MLRSVGRDGSALLSAATTVVDVHWVTDIPGREPVHVYGAGQGGAVMLRELAAAGIPIAGVVDTERSGRLGEHRLLCLEEFLAEADDRTRVVVASQFHTEIVARLSGRFGGTVFNAHPLIQRIASQEEALADAARRAPKAATHRPALLAGLLCVGLAAGEVLLPIEQLTYLLMVSALVVVGAEMLVRLLCGTPQGFFIWRPYLSVRFPPDEKATPGVHGSGRFLTNRYGMRSADPPRRPSRTVYVLGGSTVADYYLDQDRAWVQRLEAKLRQRLDSPTVWTGNLGRPANFTDNHLLVFKHLLPELPKPDLIVILAGVNDLQFALGSSYPRDMSERTMLEWTFSEMPGKGNLAERLALTAFCVRVQGWLSRRFTPDAVEGVYPPNGFTMWRNARRTAPPDRMVDRLPDLAGSLARYRGNLLRLIDASRKAAGIPIVLLTQPVLWSADMTPEEEALLYAGGVGPNDEWVDVQRYYTAAALTDGMDQFNEVMRDVCRQRAVHCVDLAALVPKSGRYFYDDMHFSDAGADLVADLVASRIAPLLAEPMKGPPASHPVDAGATR
ncbi:SGNH/GDSL hydrolase family protein [Azospirillum rugosum]|uniref:Lysophospholipase L1-like esterase n=1 Tax=Azospirillum rugosum TaxID=416170 RepID=A0ABS4SP30_9PROT|nr:GDSL-type esterase/lipase family protein [Azospirillum rugosum]MBP2294321.1 lysophospholipase L1-like esterase [Azospirillum rugosum]MDQ0527656.1 lysophospholipase L1-like esterase [Azospirillum rugosum]